MRLNCLSRPHAVGLVLLAAAGSGCDSDGSGPASRVPTTLEVTPSAATLFSAAPGNTIQVTVVTKDQDGQPMDAVGSIDFSSSDEAVSTVGQDGTITAVAPGSARITASLTVDGVTLSDVTSVTVEDAPAAATVTAPAFAYEPDTVDVSAGGEVTWTFADLAHTVTFDTPGAPESFALQGGSMTRAFPGAGVFEYHCEFHSGMDGVVRVH